MQKQHYTITYSEVYIEIILHQSKHKHPLPKNISEKTLACALYRISVKTYIPTPYKIPVKT